ncbi:unnamed protein product, partial [Ilex paraguariensis]
LKTTFLSSYQKQEIKKGQNMLTVVGWAKKMGCAGEAGKGNVVELSDMVITVKKTSQLISLNVLGN